MPIIFLLMFKVLLYQVLEIPVITDTLEEETSPEPEGSRSASFSRAGDSLEGEGRKVKIIQRVSITYLT